MEIEAEDRCETGYLGLSITEICISVRNLLIGPQSGVRNAAPCFG